MDHLAASPGDACQGVLGEVPNHRDLQRGVLAVPGRVNQGVAFRPAHLDPKDHLESFQVPQVQMEVREETVSPLEGRADQMNQGD